MASLGLSCAAAFTTTVKTIANVTRDKSMFVLRGIFMVRFRSLALSVRGFRKPRSELHPRLACQVRRSRSCSATSISQMRFQKTGLFAGNTRRDQVAPPAHVVHQPRQTHDARRDRS